MTATLRVITRRANGRESTRTTEIPGNVLTIGRATDCDINLPDLRIGLRHARVTISSGTFLIETEGDNEFTVNGRSVRRVEARRNTALVTQFGPFRLKFSEESARLCIDVERIQLASSTDGDALTDKIFSLRSTWLSKRATAWALALATVVVFLAFPIATFALKPRDVPPAARIEAGKMWSTGELSSAHHVLGQNCESCHKQAFVSVRDETCISCHRHTNHHADETRMQVARGAPSLTDRGMRTIAAAFNKPAGRCADCHSEHNGADSVAPAAQATCTSCHAGMDSRLPDTTVANASDFGRDHPQFRPTVVTVADLRSPKLTRAWTVEALDAARKERDRVTPTATGLASSCDGFAIGQPNFRGLPHDGAMPASALPGDNSGLVFPHAVHLAANGCVAGVAQRLKAAEGGGDKLVCKSCHTPTESGVGFQTVSMEKNCSSCHSLAFDSFNGAPRTLRHGHTNEVVATLLDFYRAGGGSVAGFDSGRRRPGDAAAQRYASFRTLAFAQGAGRAAERVRAVFSEGGACYGCHVITPPARPGGADYQVAPVTLRANFLPHGAFNHRAHEPEVQKCETCHAAETSRSSTDVLVPPIATCRECHGGEHASAPVQSSCVMCHGFHSTAPGATPMRPAGAAASQGSPAAQKAAMFAPRSRGTLE